MYLLYLTNTSTRYIQCINIFFNYLLNTFDFHSFDFVWILCGDCEWKCIDSMTSGTKLKFVNYYSIELKMHTKMFNILVGLTEIYYIAVWITLTRIT